ncbi:RHS repeat-associated core domain protein containing protein [Pseudomonas sp. GM18]|uniref:RHS repeat domain-containing protein n=1 Tax=Pseudomonas sp. GM18 TaxID=1144324 RepID=UPI00027265ED|nr:RHS repeat-associated core domain-containing protein [Pseudomonas sp. GM18]EJM19275.1 RHS repeat-associated core domain protein containing protein [Pseudomonas sp. GM18]
MEMHHKTPTLTVFGPRGLSIRSVDYWRAIEHLPAEARINRTVHDGAGRAVKQWDPRLWALQVGDPQVPANLATVYSLAGNVLRTDSVDAGTQINLHGLADEVVLGWDSRETRREVEYDGLLRPVAVFEQGAVEPRRSVERFTYGYPGQGNRDRNQCGQLIRHDDPAGSVLFDLFSIGGECVENTRHFTLDPVTPDWPESIDDRQPLLEPGAGATSRWRFGPLGHVLEQTDARENRQTFSLTVDGRVRESRLQLKDQPTGQSLVSEIRYNAQGQVEGEVAGNGVRTTLAYRPEDGRLMERRAYSERVGLLQHLLYIYDRMGNVLSIEDKALPVRYFVNQRIDPINRFIYDSLYQLIQAFGWEAGGPNQGPDSVGRTDPAAVSNYHQSYHYDAGGNLLKLTHVGAQNHGRDLKAARYSNHCLPWRNDVPPTEAEIAAAFDASGNLLELDQGRFLTWDLRNQLQSVSPVERDSGRNDCERYFYDGAGQRVRKIRSLQTNARTVVAEVRYLPGLELRTDNSTGEVLQVITAEGGLNSVRVLHWESPPPSGVNDQYRYTLVDHLKSCSMELAGDARIISQEVFYPYGDTAWYAGSDVIAIDYKTIRYSGKELDATGLYYYGLRYYVPWLQRWLNPDPRGGVDGPNLYRMALNNPVTFIDDDGAVTRKKQANGLWEPVIAAGAARDIPGAQYIDRGKPNLGVPATGKPTNIHKALEVRELSRVEVTTQFLDPVSGRYSKDIDSGLRNTRGGAQFIFTMDQLTYSGASKGTFNALRIVDIPKGEIPDKTNAVSGFWAPQGGYVDIPLRPTGTDPDHVFTPGFSGCSLTVDQLNDNVLRVRHVEGSKENVQYNELSAREHGMGLGAAMEFQDYAYASDGQGQQEEIRTAFAFMKYDRKQQVWNIHYQTIQGPSGIQRYAPGKTGLFNRSNAVVTAYSQTKIRKTMAKQVVTAKK